jgi:DNA replication and repair protein RecF
MCLDYYILSQQSYNRISTLFLTHLHLRQFRNYSNQTIEFSAPKTILVGENAQGKSNLLEAVELLATLQSHRTSRDSDLIQTNQPFSQLSAKLTRDSGALELNLTLRQTGRRSVALNGVSQRRQIDALGHLNLVEFSSLDLDLVRGSPVDRRTWLDTLLIQLEPYYAYLLQQYNRVLRQRNALLKQAKSPSQRASSGSPPVSNALDPLSLALWDSQLATIGTRLMRRRARALERLTPIAQDWHAQISQRREHLHIHYVPSVARETPQIWDNPDALQAAFLEKIQQRAIAEHHQGSSLVGPHRDEIDLLINDTPARQYGSQGQQRTLVLALKLAELKLIEAVTGEPPLLLLDDVLAELDLRRQNQLLEVIHDRFQTLITTTHLSAFDAQWLQSSQILTVTAGSILPA